MLLREAAGSIPTIELNGREGLKLYGANGSPVASLSRTAAGGEIQLSNSAGATVIEAKADSTDGRGLLGVGPALNAETILRGRLK